MGMRRTYGGMRLTAEQLTALPTVEDVVGPFHESMDRTYYDTPDLHLTAAGVDLWRDDGSWRAVLPTGREITATAGDAVPTELRAALAAYVGRRELAPCAHVATERERWQLVDKGGAVLVEIGYDDVDAEGVGRHAGPVGAWRAVRTEPRAGSRPLLDRLSEQLFPGDEKPAEQFVNLADFLGARPVAVDRPAGDASVADVLTAYLRRQVAALRAADVAARLGDPEATHDLRVAVRRLRSCLRVFRRYFVAKQARPVVAELARLSKRLGAARDSEVLRQRITEGLRALPSELVLGPVDAGVDRLLAHPEAEAAESLRAELDSRRYLTLHETLDRLASAPPYRRRARRRASGALPRQIAKAYRKARTAAAAAERTAAGPEHDAALHQVRKKVRRLRYACEVAEPAIGKQARKLARRSKKIQQVLGDHHDAVVARPVLRQLGVAAHLDGGNGFTFGVVHGALDERTDQLAAAFQRHWRKLTTRARRLA